MKSITAVLILICVTGILLVAPTPAAAACRYVWSDHDHNTSTPPLRIPICDNAYEIPGINPPSIPPIQTPQIRPIQPLVIPPIGTTRCADESIYNPNTGRWENKRVCR